MKNPDLVLTNIRDFFAQENFKRLQEYFDEENQLSGFKFLEFSTTAAVTNLKVPHLLAFTPKDLIRTRKTGAGSVTFNRHLFDAENIDVTTTGAVKVRLLIGTYRLDTVLSTDESTDTETWS